MTEIEKLARTFAMEYLTGHYRPLREDEQKAFEQLTVVMLAFAANVKRQLEVRDVKDRDGRDADKDRGRTD